MLRHVRRGQFKFLGQKMHLGCPVSGLVAECEGGGLKVWTCLTGAVITNTKHLLLCYTNFASMHL